MSCDYCEGPCTPMGVLGRRAHFRCRDCGLEFSLQLGEGETIESLLPEETVTDG